MSNSTVGREASVTTSSYPVAILLAWPAVPTHLPTPIQIEAAGYKVKQIQEHVGRLATGHEQVSIASMRSPGGWTEPAQAPRFDEFTLVLTGRLRVSSAEGDVDVTAGQAVVVNAGERVQYSTPEPEGAHYVAVCLPAFSPELVNREGGAEGTPEASV
jgi:mannose-6-phosphate isomerase-like protein (cupin superfamily)